MVIMISMGFVFRYIQNCYINYSRFSNYIEVTEFKSSVLFYISHLYSDKKCILMTILCVIASMLLNTGLSLGNLSFKIFPLDRGFCELK